MIEAAAPSASELLAALQGNAKADRRAGQYGAGRIECFTRQHEAIDRMAKGGTAVEPAEFSRLQQTADQNCSKDPAGRRQQEEMAARLRVSKGDTCIDARNKLADMLEPGQRPSRDQLKTQQEFIESHCTSPVR